jgi:hypothetical protein
MPPYAATNEARQSCVEIEALRGEFTDPAMMRDRARLASLFVHPRRRAADANIPPRGSVLKDLMLAGGAGSLVPEHPSRTGALAPRGRDRLIQRITPARTGGDPDRHEYWDTGNQVLPVRAGPVVGKDFPLAGVSALLAG